MVNTNSKLDYYKIGRVTCYLTFLFGILYLITTICGFLSLDSSDDPIGDPYFTMMEILTLLIAPLMAIDMVAVHIYASKKEKLISLASAFFMFVMAAISSCVHFMVLILGRHEEVTNVEEFSLLFSFKWPSMVYALDILAWDWFFAISFLLAAPVFRRGKLRNTIRNLMIISGILSLIGLLGVVLNDMQIRNIGIIGYAVVAPFVFMLIGKEMGRSDGMNKLSF